MTTLQGDQEFKRLLSRYPLLSLQLQMIYGLTLNPGPEDARTWNRQPLYGDRAPEYSGDRSRGRGRGSGVRGGRGRGGHEAQSDRPRGQWTDDKGKQDALTVIKRMREGADDDERAEALREFGELCRMSSNLLLFGFASSAGSPAGECQAGSEQYKCNIAGLYRALGDQKIERAKCSLRESWHGDIMRIASLNIRLGTSSILSVGNAEILSFLRSAATVRYQRRARQGGRLSAYRLVSTFSRALTGSLAGLRSQAGRETSRPRS
nr:hypothetical protein CFP56_76559 [Quercus suber]